MNKKIYKYIILLTFVFLIVLPGINISAINSIMKIENLGDNQIKIIINFNNSGNSVSSSLIYNQDDLCPIGENNDGEISINTSNSEYSAVFNVLNKNHSYVRTNNTTIVSTGEKIEDSGINIPLETYFVENNSPIMENKNEESDKNITVTNKQLETKENNVLKVPAKKDKKTTKNKKIIDSKSFKLISIIIITFIMAFIIFGIYCCISEFNESKKNLKYAEEYFKNNKKEW